MCLHTQRLYTCWCRDYHVKPSNRCESALSSGTECGFVVGMRFERESEGVGVCEFHAGVQGEFLGEGDGDGDARGLRRANTVVGVGQGRRDGEGERGQKWERRSDPVCYASMVRELGGQGEGRDIENGEAGRLVGELDDSGDYTTSYGTEEHNDNDDDDDDDEFTLLEDGYPDVRQLKSIQEPLTSVLESDELWDSIAREAGISIPVYGAEYSDSNYEEIDDEDDDDEFMDIEPETVHGMKKAQTWI